MLTIVMYHYVRDLPNTPFPEIKGLLTAKFDAQLDYIERFYRVVGAEEVVRASRGQARLPENACLLTFDDGFEDHYATVVPRLLERRMTGVFSVPAAALDHEVLGVHKIHHILAANPDRALTRQLLLESLRRFRNTHALPSDEELLARYAKASRYDGADVVFIKRMLQVALPPEVRRQLGAELFERFVTRDEQAFAKRLYLDRPRIREMIARGMTIGGHGHAHDWLGALRDEEQEADLARQQEFLEEVYGSVPSDWVMCFPYGSYNARTLEILRRLDCALGLTTRVGLARLDRPLELDRIDTNDLPCEAEASPCEWTRRVVSR